MTGGSGNDVLEGGEGDDHLDGNGGDDLMIGGSGVDQLAGGAGFDTVTYAHEEDGLLAWLVDGAGQAGEEELYGIEQVFGTAGSDEFYAFRFFDESSSPSESNKAVTFVGLGGDDLLVGGRAADQLEGGDGDDTIQGMAGDDVILMGGGSDTAYTALNARTKETIGQDLIRDFTRGEDGIYIEGLDSKNVMVLASRMFARLDTDKNGALTGTETSVYARTVEGQASPVLDVGKALGFTANQNTVTLLGVTTLSGSDFYG